MSTVSSGPVALPFESLLLAEPAILGIRLAITVLQRAVTPIRMVVPVVNLRTVQAAIRMEAFVATEQLELVLMAPLLSAPQALGLYDGPVQRPAIAFQ